MSVLVSMSISSGGKTCSLDDGYSLRSQRDPVYDTAHVFENTTLFSVHCKSILGLHEMFPSLVIDEIKCYEGGHFIPWRGTGCSSVDCPGGHCTL